MWTAFVLASVTGCSSRAPAEDTVTLVIGGRVEGEIEPCG